MIIEIFGNFYTQDPMSLRNAERKCVNLVKDRIVKESNYQSNLIVNLTWFWHNDESFVKSFIEWVNQYSIQGSTKIYFVAFIDIVLSFRESEFFKQIQEMGHDISFEGFGENWYTFFPSYINRYDLDDIKLNPNFTYKYLCYNRKPSTHRVNFVTKLRDNNILKSGWVTFQQGYFPEIDHLTGQTDSELFKERDLIEYYQPKNLELSRPDDIKTLGNLDIWNNSYVVIVSETTPDDPFHITEKTWKPILGMRPFLFNGCTNVLNILNKLELFTPGELFNEKELDKCDMNTTVEFVKYLCTKPIKYLYELYEHQLPMLTHNRKQFEFLSRRFTTPPIQL